MDDSDPSACPRDPVAALASLHREVDLRAAELEHRHAARLRCGRGCTDCCVDGLTVFEIEAERIRRHHAGLLEAGLPGPDGGCAFLDAQGSCRVYAHRPYVCRSQGLPLRWLERDDAGRTVELRDICPLNDDPSSPVEALPEPDCWTIGPFEARLGRLQVAFGGSARRVRLRDLFAPGDEPD